MASSMTRTQELICMYCGAKLKTRSGYHRHVRPHEGNAPHKCCGRMFFDSRKLIMHRCSVHGRKKEETCEVCGRIFGSQQQLKQHTSTVHSEPSLKCDTCGLSFKTKRNLDAHCSKHEGSKPYGCKCGKFYQYASGLSRHKRLSKHA